MRLTGMLEWTGEDLGPEREPKLRAFELFLILHATTRLWMWADVRKLEELVLAVGVSLSLVLAWHPSFRRLAVTLAAFVLLIKQGLAFPHASNHSFIECFTMSLLAFMGTAEKDAQKTVLQASRWLVVIVLFSSGLQKIFYGTYFDGQYLSYSIATDGRFLSVFKELIPPREVERLLAEKPVIVGSGPFRVDSLWFVLMSNLVYVFEMVGPILLLFKKTRVGATWACLLFVIAIEIGARELMFGALFVNLLLLFLPSALNRHLLWLWVIGYAALLGVDVGWLPKFRFN